MPSYVTPKYATAYIFYVALVDQANTKLFKSSATLAAGDVKISIDGGALADITTLPTVTPAAGRRVKVSLSSAEMTGDNIGVLFSDAAGSEWCDLFVNIQTSARQVDDLTYPTVSGRSLDVTATGEAGLDWANVGSPTTTVALSGTTAGLIDGALTAAKIGADAITAAKIADGAIDAATFAAGAINAAAIATDAITDAKVANDVTIASVTGAVGSVTGNVGGNVVGSVASVTAGVTVITNNDKLGYGLSSAAVQAIWDALTSALTTAGSIGKRIADNLDAAITSRMATFTYTAPPTVVAIRTEMDNNSTKLANLDATISSRLATASYTAPPTAAANADAVWDETLAGHLTAGSTGNALNAAGGAGDPWATAIPGAYGAGTAGKILGDNIDATISSRATQVSVDDLPTNVELATSQAAADDATIAAIAAVSVPSANAIADAVLSRGVGNVEDTADTTSLAAVVLATLESSVVGTSWVIRKTSGGTFVSKTVTVDAAADPITGVT